MPFYIHPFLYFSQLQNHDKGWDPETKFRSEEEMAEESRQLREYFSKSQFGTI